jgi:hypothetical protein
MRILLPDVALQCQIMRVRVYVFLLALQVHHSLLSDFQADVGLFGLAYVSHELHVHVCVIAAGSPQPAV